MGAFPDRQMAGNPHLPSNRNRVFQLCTASYSGLGNENTIAPQTNVVPDLHQIIDPATSANNGIGAASPIHRRISTNFNMVFYHDTSKLRHGQKLCLIVSKSKTCFAYSYTRIKTDAVTHNTIKNRHQGTNMTIISNNDTRPDNSI